MRPVALCLLIPLALGAAAPERRPVSFVLSLTGVSIKPGEYVDSFSLDTWAVRAQSVCHIPPGWQVTAGGTAAPDGVIAGRGSHGVTFLDRTRLGELNDLALVELSGPVRRRSLRQGKGSLIPATFAGTVHFGSYEREGGRTARLTFANVRLVRSARCSRG